MSLIARDREGGGREGGREGGGREGEEYSCFFFSFRQHFFDNGYVEVNRCHNIYIITCYHR